MGTLYLFVDLIDGGFATLLTDCRGDSLTVPLSVLPSGVREGDWLRTVFERAPERKAEAMDEIGKLFEDLGDNP
jgi:hypothetical protein